jgi:hypothetical protein
MGLDEAVMAVAHVTDAVLRAQRCVAKAASKITASHRGRLAVAYVRQSSVAQVGIHGESTARQYGLVATAGFSGLIWPYLEA